MPIHLATADEVSRVISQDTAPAFLLGAVAAFISVLIAHMNRMIDRINIIIARPDSEADGAHEGPAAGSTFAYEIDEPRQLNLPSLAASLPPRLLSWRSSVLSGDGAMNMVPAFCL
jgi:hypothetical protein